MREIFLERLNGSFTLTEVRNRVLQVLGQIRAQNPTVPVRYVAGIVSSDGYDRMAHNVERLERLTQQARSVYGGFVFSAVDVFGHTGLWNKLVPLIHRGQLSGDDFIEFWRAILGSGAVDEVLLTPGYERSKGATDEQRTAQKHNITLRFLHDDFLSPPS